jgi:hypothetical protein
MAPRRFDDPGRGHVEVLELLAMGSCTSLVTGEMYARKLQNLPSSCACHDSVALEGLRTPSDLFFDGDRFVRACHAGSTFQSGAGLSNHIQAM